MLLGHLPIYRSATDNKSTTCIFLLQDCQDPLDLEDHQDQEVNLAQMVHPVRLGPGGRRENLVHRSGAEEVGVSRISLNISCTKTIDSLTKHLSFPLIRS